MCAKSVRHNYYINKGSSTFSRILQNQYYSIGKVRVLLKESKGKTNEWTEKLRIFCDRQNIYISERNIQLVIS